jgi:hypothetical protein
MKFILFDKIRIGDVEEAKRFYYEYLYMLIKRLFLNDWRYKHNNYTLLLQNPHYIRSYDYVLMSEEIFQNFVPRFEKALYSNQPCNDLFIGIAQLEDEIVMKISESHDRSYKGFDYTSHKLNSLKETIPLLKNFNPSYTKKVNIDKKILRKFKNFLKEHLDKLSNGVVIDQFFWDKFIKENLLPPMKYVNQHNRVHEYKSFNLKYLSWFFNIEGCLYLYEQFLLAEGKETLDSIIKDYELEEREAEREQLQFYFYHIAEVFYNHERGKKVMHTEAPPLYEEDMYKMYENYLGQDFNINNSSLNDPFIMIDR